MTDRPIKEFITPAGHKLVLKTYLTAREMFAVTDQDGLKASEKTILLAQAGIVTFDGLKDGDKYEGSDTIFSLSETLLDLPAKEYSAIATELAGLITDLTGTK